MCPCDIYTSLLTLSISPTYLLQISTPPEEALCLTILGYEFGSGSGYELLCQLDSDNIATFTCPLELMRVLLENTELDEDDDNTSCPLEAKFLKSIPGICSICCGDTVITHITARLEKLP